MLYRVPELLYDSGIHLLWSHKMYRTVAAVALACFTMFSTATYAASGNYVDTSNLTEEQRADLQIRALQLAKEKAKKEQTEKETPIPVVVRQEAEKWADLGKNIGVALVSSAKEIGMAANDFAVTPLGRITSAIVVWKLMGKDFVHMVIGVSILVAGFWFAFYMFNRFTRSRVEYEYVSRLWGLWFSKKIKTVTVRDGDWFTGGFIVTAITIAITLITAGMYLR